MNDGGRVILIGGGVRSGKSAFGLALARRMGGRRLFLATAQAGDAEMAERIARHRRQRGDDFATVEEPLELAEAIARHHDKYDVVVVDCLTLWLSNLLLAADPPDPIAIADRVEGLAHVLAARRLGAIVITNEVGMGIVPESELGRLFRDAAGRAHQRLARVADEVYLAALGVLLRIKPTVAFVAHTPEDEG